MRAYEPLLDRSDVLKLTKLTSAQLDEAIADETIPAPILIGNKQRWPAAEFYTPDTDFGIDDLRFFLKVNAEAVGRLVQEGVLPEPYKVEENFAAGIRGGKRWRRDEIFALVSRG